MECDVRKLQVPSSKLQGISKFQAPGKGSSGRGIHSASAWKSVPRGGQKQADEGSRLKRNKFRAPAVEGLEPFTLPELLEEAAARFNRRTALIYFDGRITYGQLLKHVNCCAAGLQTLGLKKGDRVALMMPNCPQFVIAYFAALRAGAIVTATSSMYTPPEAAHQWQDAGATMLIVEEGIYHVAKTACLDVPAIRTVIRTRLRDYYPRRFAALNRLLRANGDRRVSSKFPLVTRHSPLVIRHFRQNNRMQKDSRLCHLRLLQIFIGAGEH